MSQVHQSIWFVSVICESNELVSKRNESKRFSLREEGQATKGSRWIPRHTEAKKDVDTDDMLWGAGIRH